MLSLGLAGHLAANLAMTSGLLYVSSLNYSGSLHLLDAASPPCSSVRPGGLTFQIYLPQTELRKLPKRPEKIYPLGIIMAGFVMFPVCRARIVGHPKQWQCPRGPLQ